MAAPYRGEVPSTFGFEQRRHRASCTRCNGKTATLCLVVGHSKKGKLIMLPGRSIQTVKGHPKEEGLPKFPSSSGAVRQREKRVCALPSSLSLSYLSSFISGPFPHFFCSGRPRCFLVRRPAGPRWAQLLRRTSLSLDHSAAGRWDAATNMPMIPSYRPPSLRD